MSRTWLDLRTSVQAYLVARCASIIKSHTHSEVLKLEVFIYFIIQKIYITRAHILGGRRRLRRIYIYSHCNYFILSLLYIFYLLFLLPSDENLTGCATFSSRALLFCARGYGMSLCVRVCGGYNGEPWACE